MTSPIAELTASLIALVLAFAGLCLMFQRKKWAGRLLWAALALAIGMALLASVPVAQGVASLSWQAALALLAIGFCVVRQWGLSALLAAPLVGALLWPTAPAVPMMLAIIASALLAIGLVTRLLNAIWGPEVTGQVVGTYLIRLIDGTFALPFKLAQRRSARNSPQSST